MVVGEGGSEDRGQERRGYIVDVKDKGEANAKKKKPNYMCRLGLQKSGGKRAGEREKRAR